MGREPGGGRLGRALPRVTRASRAARHNHGMENTTDPRPDLVSRVRDVRRVPLERLAGRSGEARTERETIPFNSSI